MDSLHTSNVTSSQHRVYTTLDGMRFVAAIIVVTVHVNLFNAIALPERFLAVDLFFVLSGFVISKAYERKLLLGMSPSAFLLRRIIRLYPLYLLGIIFGLGAGVFGNGGATLRTLYHLLFSAVLVPNPDGLNDLFPLDGPVWSLFFEFLVNVLYVACLSKLKGRLLVVTLGFTALSLVVFAVGLHSVNFGWKLKTIPGGLSRVIFSFYAGVILYRFHSRSILSQKIAIKSNIICWVILALVAILLCCPVPVRFAQPFELFAIFCLFPGLVFLAIHFEPTGVSSRLFLIGGVLSYAVYIIHEPLGRILGPLLWENGSTATIDAAVVPGILFFTALMLVSICASYMYDVPIRQRLARWIKDSDRTTGSDVPHMLSSGASEVGGNS